MSSIDYYNNHKVPTTVQKLVDHASHLVDAYRALSDHYDEIPGTYDGTTYYNYMNVKSIKVKNQFVYIKAEEGPDEYNVTGERVPENWIHTPGCNYIEWTTNLGVISVKRTEKARKIIEREHNFSQGCWAVSAKGKKAYPKEFVFNSSERV